MADIFGTAGTDKLLGTASADRINGWLGADQMIGGLGNDIYYVDNPGDVALELGNAGQDRVLASISATLGANIEDLQLIGAGNINGTGNSLNNALIGNIGDNQLDGGAGNDTLAGGLGSNVLMGGSGNDTYVVGLGNDTFTELAGQGTDTVLSNVSFSLAGLANIENLTLAGSGAVLTINGTGNALNNVITGDALGNTLDGGAGDDRLFGNANFDVLLGGDGNDLLDGGTFADTLIGGKGNDTYVVDDVNDAISEAIGQGKDLVLASASYDLSSNPGQEIENLTLTGNAEIDGYGNDLDNIISGNARDNTLSGGKGNDILIGGGGGDHYLIDSLGDKVVEGSNAGDDTVVVLGAFSYVLGANLEYLRLDLATGDVNGTGNSLDNVIGGNDDDNKLDGAAGNDDLAGGGGNDTLIGGVGDDFLSGNAGDDKLIGGAGNDTYQVGTSTDTIVELAGQGIDTVRSGNDYNLGLFANLENLILTGAAFIGQGNGVDNTILGTGLANQLFGFAGNDTLDGGGGIDSLIGGTGNDIYRVDNASDKVFESAGEGTDLVQASVGYDLFANAGQEIENLTLTGSGNTDGYGNDLGNVITGNGGANYLYGGKGNDTVLGGAGDDSLEGGDGNDSLAGGIGDDSYFVESLADKVIEAANAGYDTVYVLGGINYTLGANVERLDFVLASGDVNGTGNSLDNVIQGNIGANKLDGGAGNDQLFGEDGDDTLIGGTGNDTYFTSGDKDTIVELAGQGTDTVVADKDYNLALFANLENLTLTGAAFIGQGNGVDNYIQGTGAANQLFGLAGNDILDGQGGVDTLSGGLGNDVYFVDSASDAIFEAAGEGKDLVKAAVNYDLSSNVGQEIENLTLTGSAADGTGNDLNNVITGNGNGNFLNGGKGNDTLIGGKGDDNYYVDSLADKVVEAAGEGIDTVNVLGALGYALAASVENLSLFTAVGDVNGTGNSLDNDILGNKGANKLDGGAGNDDLDGGFGNDTLIGGAGNDLLDGGGGDDGMTGGAGNDTYYVDSALDKVTEAGGGGVDLVLSYLDFNLSTGGLNVENLQLLGGTVTGIGNDLDNVITGNGAANLLGGGLGNDTLLGGGGGDTLSGAAGNDILDGQGGIDKLSGGLGNDVYFVDSASDAIFEAAGEGKDLVKAAVNYDLSSNAGQEIENLTLTGGATFGTGNGLNNIITGTAGSNYLDGGAGNDTLIGGKDADTYVVDSLGDKVVEAANEGLDRIIVLGAFSYALGANIEVLDLSGATGNVGGAGNALDNEIDGNNKDNKLDGGAGNDTLNGNFGNDTLIGGAGNDLLDGGAGDDVMTGGAGNDTYYVNSALDTVTEAGGGGVDLILSYLDFNLSTGGLNVENLQLLGGTVTGIGNDLDNVITGNGAANLLAGGLGNDTLLGGGGGDTLFGASGNDILDGGLGADSLSGGAGDDLFLYRLASNSDLANLGGDSITGFETGKDRIDVTDLFSDFGIGAGVNPFADGFLTLEASGANTLVKFDGDGAAGGNSFVILATVTNAIVAPTDLVF